MAYTEGIAHITCDCGHVFQVLNEAGDDWDEAATAKAYDDHLKTCNGGA